MHGSPKRLGARWHDERRKHLFRDHPEARALIGPNPWTAVAVVSLVALQLSIAASLSEAPWWAVLVLGYAVGAFVSHALGVLIHDAVHDLVFRSATANRWLAMLANVPLVFPAAMDFREKHLKHHAHLGEPNGADTQAPQRWDFRFVTNRLRAFIWHAAGPILTHSDAPPTGLSRWVLINALVNLSCSVAIAAIFGFHSLVYLGVASLAAFGHHPVGIRRYGEHLTLRNEQPTVSYYGPLNRLSFDVGFHVEHHDLPSVPWNRLRRLKQLAPELYADLASLQSWSSLLWQLTTVPGEGPAKYFLEQRPELEEHTHSGGLPV